ncbi:MAG: spore coat protein [Clostridia bacterium]|jgi:spore coat protein CotF|nr:spore coat protein [Clostridia bacterium]MCI1998925.1 spore coat protein [Clostridia bacterium]MCI2013675.1 spore coat protein [Clostridia bacterium]
MQLAQKEKLQLTQKETLLLKDLKEQEQICVEKYSKYSSEAHDKQLKDLFAQIGQTEQQHLDTINQILNGNVPSMQSGQSKKVQLNFTPTYDTVSSDQNKQLDNYLCTDVLSTEKHVSSVYNTSVFEFKNTDVRSALNHIQKEEQEHGEQIYNYMAQNGMYN